GLALRLPGAGAGGQADLLPPVARDHPGRGRVRRAAGQQVPLALGGDRDDRAAGLPGPAAAGALLRRPGLRDDRLTGAAVLAGPAGLGVPDRLRVGGYDQGADRPAQLLKRWLALLPGGRVAVPVRRPLRP